MTDQEQAKTSKTGEKIRDLEDQVIDLQVELEELKAERAIKPFASGDLAFRDISPNGATYRFTQTSGAEMPNSHFSFARSAFPDDPNFNMSFINSTLTREKLLSDEAFDIILKKQAGFRKLLKAELVIKLV